MQPVKFDRLKNGIMCYSRVDRVSNAGGVGVRCGSFNDPPGKAGLKHLIEHVLASGWDEQSEYFYQLHCYEKYMGGPDESAMIQTDGTTTFYGVDNLYYRRHFVDCFNIICDYFRRWKSISDISIIDPIVEREKSRVIGEYALRGDDDPPEFAEILLRKLIYSRNPAGKRTDCELPEFETVSGYDFLDNLREFYVPEDMFVIVIGPSLIEVKKWAESHFGDMPVASKPKLHYDKSDNFPEIKDVRETVHIFQGLKTYHLSLGFPTEPFSLQNSSDEDALDVLARILSFRLRMKLQACNFNPKNKIYRTFAKAERTYLHGMFTIWCPTTSGDFIKSNEEIMLDEFKKLREQLVSGDEIDDIKLSLATIHRQMFRDTPGNLMNEIMECIGNGDEKLKSLHGYLDGLKKVNRHKIRDVVNKYFPADVGYARVIVAPEWNG